ncbi:unnamed protein product, partial [Ixodes persulcatus]
SQPAPPAIRTLHRTMETFLRQLRRLALLVSASPSQVSPPGFWRNGPPVGSALPPPTAELVGALTSALRAAFPEIRQRRPRFPPVAQPFPSVTDDDEDDPFLNDFATSQDPPGGYRARVPDADSEDSDSEAESSPERDRGRY